jgi:hypothetical protein
MIFVDKNSAIDKESLRIFALDKLKDNKDLLQVLMTKPVWEKLHNLIGSQENKLKLINYRKSQSQLLGLGGFIDSYIKTALDSSERFELFVQVKAVELKSKDQQHDYFWALQIRHDQVVAIVEVIEKIVRLVDSWSEMNAKDILEDEEYLKLAHTSIEDQVYLEAERVYKERNKILSRS